MRIDPRSAPPVDWLEVAFLITFLVFGILSWVGIALASLHLFRASLLFTISAVIAGPLLYLAVRDLQRAPSAVHWPSRASCIAIGALTGIAAALFFHPAEYVFNGDDGSVYVAIARIIEKSGGITMRDPLLNWIPDSGRSALFAQSPWPVLFDRFPGGIQIANGQDEIVTNFYPLFPIWLATFSTAFGPEAAFFVSPALALLSLIALWLLARRLSSPAAALLACLLLTVNFAELWFARFPASEMQNQLLMLAGLFFTILFVDTARPSAGAAAGAAFGLGAFARIDNLLLVTPAILVLLLMFWRKNGASVAWRWYAGVFVGLTLHGVLYGLIVSSAYTLRILRTWVLFTSLHTSTVVLAAAILSGVLVLWRMGSLRQGVRSPGIRVVALGIVLILAFAGTPFWTRVFSGPFSLLFSQPGIVLLVAGLSVLMAEQPTFRAAPSVLLFLCSAVLYLRWQFDERSMPWVWRRSIPIILPLGTLFVAHLAARAAGRFRYMRGPAFAVPVFLGAFFLRTAWPIVETPVMRHGYAALREVADQIPADALFLCDPSTSSHLALALQYNFDRPTLLVPLGPGVTDAVESLIRHVTATGRRVFLLVSDRHGEYVSSVGPGRTSRFSMNAERSLTLRSVTLEATQAGLPRNVRTVTERLELYRVLPRRGPATRASLPVRIDIGIRDFPYVLSGFYPAESFGDATGRWTRGETWLQLPPLAVRPAAGADLVLRIASYRPPSIPAPAIAVRVGGQDVGQFAATLPDFGEYRLRLPAGFAETSGDDGPLLTLRSTTFSPRRAGGGDDDRSLGFILDWLAILPASGIRESTQEKPQSTNQKN